jgi:hypothetical protein
MARAFIPPETCPVCGETVPRDAKTCPGCGADERSGWDEDATRYDDLDLPDAAFADDGKPAPRRTFSGGRFWIGVTAIALVILTIALILR